MSEPLDLDLLDAVALRADDGGRRWTHRDREATGYPQQVVRVGDVALVAECYESPEYPPVFAEFIATFDPPTVLALIRAARAGQGAIDSPRKEEPVTEDKARIVGRDLSPGARELAEANGWAPHARMHPKTAREYEQLAQDAQLASEGLAPEGGEKP